MRWLRDFALRHRLSADAEDELSAHLSAPLSGVFGDADVVGEPRDSSGADFEQVGLLGRGGLGEVHRAIDLKLGRNVALKVLRADRAHDPAAHTEFAREARVLASLQHPGIPPVYGIGTLPDGRPYVAMAEVVGKTLRQVCIDHHHGAEWLTLRRRVGLVRQLAEAAGHAHRIGIAHRDIKPSNAMLAEGNVHLVDWGLALPLDACTAVAVGTPAFMAPEVARGEAATTQSDVWSLGRVLHALLSPDALLGPVPVADTGTSGLAPLVQRALHDDPAQRWPDAAAFAGELADWLDGDARLAQARQLVQQADRLHDEATAAQSRFDDLRAKAKVELRGVLPTDPVSAKRAGWDLEASAGQALDRVHTLQTERLRVLEEALNLAPELPSVLEPLADWYRLEHEQALESGDSISAARSLVKARQYDRGRLAPWLRGMARITLHTQPAGAEVTLCRYETRDRRLVPAPDRSLGTTPLEVELPHGAYLLRIDHPDRASVTYPVFLERLGHWTGGLHDAPRPVYLPATDELATGECYVPAGPFLSGANEVAFQSRPPTRSFLPGFVMCRHPVTQEDYLRFLNDLVARGEPDRAHLFAPRDRGMEGSFYGRTDQGYELVPDADGDLWLPDWPAFFMNAAGAEAYASWWSQRTGQEWTLPLGLQHEKALRGADGRAYPWGDHFDPTFACLRESHTHRPLPARIDDFSADCSVYGVRGLSGNVRAWCQDLFAPYEGEIVPTQRELRGGCFFFPSRGAHGAARMGLDAHRSNDTVGIRLVRGLDPVDDASVSQSEDEEQPR